MKAVKIFYLLIIIGILFPNYAMSQNFTDNIIGMWYTPEKLSVIQIYKINNKYYGKIAWEKEPNDKNGNPKNDIHNPNPELRHKPLHGLVIMKDLQFDGKKEWIKGKIYNPETGNKYKIKIEMLNINTLKVRGYIGVSLIGKSSVWKRKS